MKLSAPARFSALATLAALGLAAVPAHAQQTLFVGNDGDNTITKFNSAGIGTKLNISGDVNGPIGLAFNSAGNLFVSNNGDNTIEEFNSAGIGTKFNVSGDVSNPAGLAFSPSSPAAVPEASTTVSFGLLLALGLGGMVVASKRQKRIGC